MKRGFVYYFFLNVSILLLFPACTDYSPKPSGYFRIDLPEVTYAPFNKYPFFTFDLPSDTEITEVPHEESSIAFNIVYPALNAEIYCTYLLTKRENLNQLYEESRTFVYRHATKADAIETHKVENHEHNTQGLIYDIKGNVASPTQFVLTDGEKSFFRGALYFNITPNQDSIAPVLEHINQDIQVIIRSFQWKE